jgi:hypothetical protein
MAFSKQIHQPPKTCYFYYYYSSLETSPVHTIMLIRLRSHITCTSISAPTLQKSSLAISPIDNLVSLALPLLRKEIMGIGRMVCHLVLMRNVHQACYSGTCEFSFWYTRRVYLLTLLVCIELLYFLNL